MSEGNPFEKFIVDENAPLDKELVAKIVEPFLESIGKNKVIRYKEIFERSPFWIKVSVYLCIRKMMLDLGIVKDEKIGPRELSEDTGIPFGTAKDISRDKNLKKIIEGSGMGYFIPNYNLKKLKKMLEENGKSNSKK